MRKNHRASGTIPEIAFAVKYLGFFIAFMPVIFMSKDLAAYPAQIVPMIFLGLLGIFCLTATEIRASENVVMYRRFVSWKEIRYDEIVECRGSWNPWFGYLRPTKSVPPWGKIYFVALRPMFTGSPRDLIAFINSHRRESKTTPPITSEVASDGKNKDVLLCGFTCFLGFTVVLMWAYLSSDFLPMPQLAGVSPWYASVRLLLYHAVAWPWAVGTIAILLALILYIRFKSRAWFLAFGVGMLLGSILVTALH